MINLENKKQVNIVRAGRLIEEEIIVCTQTTIIKSIEYSLLATTIDEQEY